MTAEQARVFKQAAERWQQVIVGDLPDVETAPGSGISIDDISLVAFVEPIDGPGGTLGQAGPDIIRANGLPLTAHMQFDVVDLVAMEADGTLFSVVLHEMGHALGIGTLWSRHDLIDLNGTINATYVGPKGVAAFNAISGLQPRTSFPIETDGGPGTAFAHWDDEMMQTELMTGFSGPGNYMPISLVTVGSLEDMGYIVNYAAAGATRSRANQTQLPKSRSQFSHRQ